jgi:regulator of sigma E protease
VHNPDWQQINIRMSIDGNATVPVTVARATGSGEQTLPLHLNLTGAATSDGPDPLLLGLDPRIQQNPVTIADVEANYPLGKAGVRAGDQIESINGLTLHSTGAVSAYLQQNGAHPVTIVTRRGDQTSTASVMPVLGDDGTGKMGYRLGFRAQPPPYTVQQQPLTQAAAHSWHYNLQNSGYIVEVLRKLFSRHSPAKQLMGPVGIAKVTGEAVTMPGWQPIINLMAMISLNLGIFNLLPFPILDGGMILLLIIESIMRHDLNNEVKERIYQVALVVLVLFFVFVTFNDVSRLAGFSKI